MYGVRYGSGGGVVARSVIVESDDTVRFEIIT